MSGEYLDGVMTLSHGDHSTGLQARRVGNRFYVEALAEAANGDRFIYDATEYVVLDVVRRYSYTVIVGSRVAS